MKKTTLSKLLIVANVEEEKFEMFAHPVRLEKKQILPISIEEAWDYFSSPKNLAEITPDYMNFKVLTPAHELENMYAGQIITYKVHPIFGIALRWTTEITQVEHGKFFIDEQRFGPYKFWHHQHHFERHDDGVLMTDIVHYMLPLGPLGWLVRKLFVERQLQGIFDYREEKTNSIFRRRSVIQMN